jgi:hypothetical protein
VPVATLNQSRGISVDKLALYLHKIESRELVKVIGNSTTQSKRRKEINFRVLPEIMF